MRGLAVLHSWLRHVSESATIDGLKLVALLLTFPVFELHNLLFKLAYALNSRRLRLIGRQQGLLGFDYVTLERELDLIDSCLRIGSSQSLNEVSRRLEAIQAHADFS